MSDIPSLLSSWLAAVNAKEYSTAQYVLTELHAALNAGHLAEIQRLDKALADSRAECERLRKLNDDWCANAKSHLDEADAANSLANIADECRASAERECHLLRRQLDQLQPLVSVLGDYDWDAIAECGWHPEEDGPALTAACRALAHVAREKAKEGSK